MRGSVRQAALRPLGQAAAALPFRTWRAAPHAPRTPWALASAAPRPSAACCARATQASRAANGSRTASACASEASSSARVAARSAAGGAQLGGAQRCLQLLRRAQHRVEAFFGGTVDDEASAARRSFIRCSAASTTESPSSARTRRLASRAQSGLAGRRCTGRASWPCCRRTEPRSTCRNVVQMGAIISAGAGAGDALYIFEKGKLLHKGRRLVRLHSDPASFWQCRACYRLIPIHNAPKVCAKEEYRCRRDLVTEQCKVPACSVEAPLGAWASSATERGQWAKWNGSGTTSDGSRE